MSLYSIQQQTSDSAPILLLNGVPFHSARDPFREAGLLGQWKNPEDFPQVVLLVEIGLGYVLSFFHKHPDIQDRTTIFCLFQEESGYNIFEQYRTALGWPQAVQSLLFSNRGSWEGIFSRFSPHSIGIWLHPTFLRLCAKESQFLHQNLNIVFKRSLMNQITDVAFGFRWWRNAIRNLTFSRISPLSLPKSYLKDKRPFLLIGSGFTAYEQIKDLSRLQKYYWIIAALPVLDLLQKWDITPDILIMTDPGSPNRFYRAVQNLPSHTLLVTYGYVYPLILEWFPGVVLGINGGLEQEECLTPFWEQIPSGGSVANTMLAFASILSVQTFYTGFDFGYTKGHPHYPGSPLETNALLEGTRYSMAETHFAKRVWGSESLLHKKMRTSKVLKAYGEHFEEQCHLLRSKGHIVSPWRAEMPTCENPKGYFNHKYLSHTAAYSVNRKQNVLALKKNYDLLEKSMQEETITFYSCWKSLLSKSLLKKEDSRKVLLKEKRFIAQLLQRLETEATSEN